MKNQLKIFCVLVVLMVGFPHVASASQDIEAFLTKIDFQLRSGERGQVQIDSSGTLKSIVVVDKGKKVKVTRSEFGEIRDVVLNDVKIYASANLKDDGSFDHYVYFKIPFNRGTNLACRASADSTFPHGCDVFTVFFSNLEYDKEMSRITRSGAA